jgi:hypothetical protein
MDEGDWTDLSMPFGQVTVAHSSRLILVEQVQGCGPGGSSVAMPVDVHESSLGSMCKEQ